MLPVQDINIRMAPLCPTFSYNIVRWSVVKWSERVMCILWPRMKTLFLFSRTQYSILLIEKNRSNYKNSYSVMQCLRGIYFRFYFLGDVTQHGCPLLWMCITILHLYYNYTKQSTENSKKYSDFSIRLTYYESFVFWNSPEICYIYFTIRKYIFAEICCYVTFFSRFFSTYLPIVSILQNKNIYYIIWLNRYTYHLDSERDDLIILRCDACFFFLSVCKNTFHCGQNASIFNFDISSGKSSRYLLRGGQIFGGEKKDVGLTWFLLRTSFWQDRFFCFFFFL